MERAMHGRTRALAVRLPMPHCRIGLAGVEAGACLLRNQKGGLPLSTRVDATKPPGRAAHGLPPPALDPVRPQLRCCNAGCCGIHRECREATQGVPGGICLRPA